ncbi:HK97-gp10 family putative phage morphogenesis protein [Chitiniphilus eburneus]|uniref:HK97-gp10 family putative phage morphogenesis protein n=1 Tax=Chitiniphilus eburneus TaxID=2571148 RepID=UPI0035CEF5CE
MADSVGFKIEGLDRAIANMKALPKDLRAKGARFAMRKAALVVLAAAQAGARGIDDPKTAESIEKNLVVRFSNKMLKRTGDIMFRVGVLGGARAYANTRENVRRGRVGQSYATGGSKGNPGGDTFHWRFVEFGTEKMPAKPFMRPAMQRAVPEATAVAVRELDKAITRTVKRRGGR